MNGADLHHEETKEFTVVYLLVFVKLPRRETFKFSATKEKDSTGYAQLVYSEDSEQHKSICNIKLYDLDIITLNISFCFDRRT